MENTRWRHLCPGSILLAKICKQIVFAILAKKIKENCYQKNIEEIANFAKIAKVTRIFLTM